MRAFEKYNKPGIQNKLLMWVFAPAYYTPYPIARLLSKFRKGKQKDVSQMSSVGGPSEIKLTRFLIKNLSPSDVFYDIGANEGFYTLLGLHFCETHSFEPLPDVFVDLCAASNKGERKPFLVNMALADKSGKDIFYVNSADSGSSTMIAARTEIDKEAYTPIKVRKTTLDEYLKTNPAPTVIIEGGIVFDPTPQGVELFLWAHGKGDTLVGQFLEGDVTIIISGEIDLPTEGMTIVEPVPPMSPAEFERRWKMKDQQGRLKDS